MPTRSSENKPISRMLDLLQNTARRLFPPRQTHPQLKWKNKGRQKVSHQTVNGVVQIRGRVYWNKQTGSLTPLDQWLGIADAGYSRRRAGDGLPPEPGSTPSCRQRRTLPGWGRSL